MAVSGQFHAPAALPPRERAPGTHWIGGLVGTRAGLDAVAKRKNLAPAWNLTLIVQQVTWSLHRLSYPGSGLHVCSVTSLRRRISIILLFNSLDVYFSILCSLVGHTCHAFHIMISLALIECFCFAGRQVFHVHRVAEQARWSEQTPQHSEPSPLEEPTVPDGQGTGQRQITEVQFRLHSASRKYSADSELKALRGPQNFKQT